MNCEWTLSEVEVFIAFSSCTFSVYEGRSRSFLSLGWVRLRLGKLSILGIWMSIADNWLREKEQASVSFLGDVLSLLVLLSCWYTNVFSSMWACRGSYGDPFQTDNRQYHLALSWENGVKKSCSVPIRLAVEHVLKCLVSYSAETVS